MRKASAAFFVAFLLIVLAVPTAEAATSVSVRIEGKSETLFENTIPVAVHGIKASSDTIERQCDGINLNDPWNLTPGVTPTLASVEAMASLGEGFDGQWYEGYEDYFLTRWGPDAQAPGAGAYWGILVNEVFTNVGGCQYQLNDDDQVLWVYDAFEGRPSLALFPTEAHYGSGPRPLTAVAQLGQPFPVEVVSYADDEESVPGSTPSRSGSSAYAGAEVAPVLTSSQGFQKVDTESPETVTTNSEGKASIVFTEPGWHRIKATRVVAGEETVIRSNRIDVCVPAKAGDCEDPPPPAPTPPATSAAAPAPGAPREAPARIGGAKLDRAGLASGRVGVSWRVLDPGAGIKRWQISVRRLGSKGARFVKRASGKRGTSAVIHLAAGGTYRLRLTVTDLLGSESSVGLGKVTVPRPGPGLAAG